MNGLGIFGVKQEIPLGTSQPSTLGRSLRSLLFNFRWELLYGNYLGCPTLVKAKVSATYAWSDPTTLPLTLLSRFPPSHCPLPSSIIGLSSIATVIHLLARLADFCRPLASVPVSPPAIPGPFLGVWNGLWNGRSWNIKQLPILWMAASRLRNGCRRSLLCKIMAHVKYWICVYVVQIFKLKNCLG